MLEPPLTIAELAAGLDRVGGFEERPLIAVAVSGGPDSLALMLLADRWARPQGGRAWGLTVDHGLRPDSAAEADTVAGWLRRRGIPHAILRWEGRKPSTGVQEAAREARYRLLAEWCRAQGVLHLLTAHHREDQHETYLIRRAARSGPDGLAGMASVRELPGCRLVRPLLTVPRARLAAFLAREQQPFLDDPSNLNPAFERARLRRCVLDPEQIGTIATELAARAAGRAAREGVLDQLIGRAVALHPAGFAAVDAAGLAASETCMAERLLSRVAACIGGMRYPARQARVARLRKALSAEPQRARTLGNCRFVPWRGRILVLREVAAASPPARLVPGTEIWWDRRYLASSPPGTEGELTLGYLGRERVPHSGSLPGLVHDALLALRDGNGIAAVPDLGYVRPGFHLTARIAFRPAHPLTTAVFTVV